ncbi:MAG: hypothetical protein HY537_18435, partial [Deltaproteobacteria bacterium]|nr:hypothetical protein [Deltaproteobacteria bacterium]
MADAMLIRRHIFLLTLTLFTALAPNLHSEVEVKVFVFVHRGSRSGELVEALLKREESGAWKIEYAQTTMDVPNQEVHALFDQLFINKERPAFRSSVRKIYGGKPAGITGTSMAKISENPQLVFHLDTDQKIQTIEAALERHPSPLTYQKSTTNWQPIVDYSLPLQAIILKTNMPARQRYQVLAKGANRRPDLFTVVALEELPDGKVKIAPVWPARRAMYLGPMTQIPTWTIDKEQLILDAGEQASVRSNAVSIEKAFRNAFGQPTATIRPTELQHDERLFSLLFNADELSLEREKIQWRSYLRDHPREPFYNFRIRVIPDTRTVVMIDRSSGIVEIRLTKNDLAKLGPGDPTLAIRNGGLDVLPGV